MKLRKVTGVTIFTLFLVVQIFLSPQVSVSGSDTPFQISDQFTFVLDRFDSILVINDTLYFDFANFSLPSISEPFDITVTGISSNTTNTTNLPCGITSLYLAGSDILNMTCEEVPTEISQFNITSTIDFHNSSLEDPTGNFYGLTDAWNEDIFSSGLGIILIGLIYEPGIFSFEAPGGNFTEVVNNSTITNSSLLFAGDQELILPLFVGSNDSLAQLSYNDYIAIASDSNFLGSTDTGFYNSSTSSTINGNDVANGSQSMFIRQKYNSSTKLFEWELDLDLSLRGSKNGIDYTTEFSFLMNIVIDYNRGIVQYANYDLVLDIVEANASLFLSTGFTFQEYSFVPTVTTSSITTDSNTSNQATSSITSTTDSSSSNTGNATGTGSSFSDTTTSNSRSLISSQPNGATLSRSLQDSSLTDGSTNENSSSENTDISPANFTSLIIISLTITTLQYFKRKRK